MDYKNNVALFGLVFLVVGICVGWLIWGSSAHRTCMAGNGTGMIHTMADGSMMGNAGMDMQSMMDGMAASLEGKRGDAFDKAFIDEMIVHHQGAVVMAEQVLKTSKRPELLKLANDIISAQTGEIKMMQGWRGMWFGN